MSRVFQVLSVAALIPLAACAADGATPPPSEPKPPAAERDCGAGKLAAYVNLLPTESALADIRKVSGAGTIRVIAPGDAVTMDYRADRLDIETGEDGRIKRFRCG